MQALSYLAQRFEEAEKIQLNTKSKLEQTNEMGQSIPEFMGPVVY